jgi:proline iminopeptidase
VYWMKAIFLGCSVPLLFSLSSVQAAFHTSPIQSQVAEIPFKYHAMGQPNAPKVILLGGGPGFSSWNLEPIQAKMAKMGYRVLLTDMLGIGENRTQDESQKQHSASKPNRQGLVIKDWISQIDGLVSSEAAQTEKVILVGHSWGALMAMLYARAHPDKVAKIIMLNPVDPEKAAMQNLTDEIQARNQANIDHNWDDDQAWSNSFPESQQDLEYLTLRQIQQVLPTYFMDYELGVEYAQQFTVSDFNIELNINAWKAYDENPIQLEALQKSVFPLSFIDCHQDYLMPYNLNAMQDKVGFQQVDLIDQCGHFPWIEQADRFYHLLKIHLETTPDFLTNKA